MSNAIPTSSQNDYASTGANTASEPRGVGFNDDSTNTINPFHDVNSAASLGATQAGTLEDFAQPRVGGVVVDQDASAPRASAADTLGGTGSDRSAGACESDLLCSGVTSQDVHDRYGHPGQGMTSKELHHDGQQKRDRQRVGGAEAKHGSKQFPRDESEQ
jgi:hypothetical protein